MLWNGIDAKLGLTTLRTLSEPHGILLEMGLTSPEHFGRELARVKNLSNGGKVAFLTINDCITTSSTPAVRAYAKHLHLFLNWLDRSVHARHANSTDSRRYEA